MNKTLIAASVGSLLVVSGCASFERDRDFDGRLYVGAGGLISQLEPDTDAVDGVDVDESQSAGGSVLLGYDVSNRFSVEGNYAVLGEATLEPEGEVEYNVAGLSALVYALGDAGNRARREGFSVFGRAGIGQLDNDSDVEFEQVNDFNLLLGLGAEYGFGNGLGVRGELVAHDEDVAYGQLAVLYRFGEVAARRGGGRERASSTTPQAPETSTAPSATTRPVPAPSAPTGRTPVDADRDGIADTRDACPDTLAGSPVDGQGCDVFDGAVDGLTFESGSDTLTASAQGVLDEIAATLGEYPTTRVAIEAHTDNSGDAQANLQLSRRRAIAVARYLVGQGIAGDRLQPRAFGESQPAVSNATPEGRATNRRVEFRTVE